VAQNVVCHFLDQEFDAIERSQRGKIYGEAKSGPCVTGESYSFSLRRPVDELDGDWHILPFPGGVFTTMYEAPARAPAYPQPTTTLRKEGTFAVREVAWPAFVCPSNPNDLCVSWHPRDEEPEGYFCTDEAALPCVQQGLETELYVMDPLTEHAIKFHYFRQAQPHVQVTDRTIHVITDRCDQQATL
jgi:hypothetical protein